MAMEVETISLIISGFSIIIVSYLVILIVLFRKNRSKNLIWFGLQILFLAVSLYYILKVLNVDKDVHAVMLSETNSLFIILSGMGWVISMVFMMIGIWHCCKTDRST